jgi:hypothetical protein
VAAQERTDLLAALLEERADRGAHLLWERDRRGSAHEVEEERFNVGPRVETRRRHGVARRSIKRKAQKDRDRPEVLRAVVREKSVGRLTLDHEHHPLGQRAGEDGVEPWRRNRVGQVRDDFESRHISEFPAFARGASARQPVGLEARKRMVDCIAVQKREPAAGRRHERRSEVCVKANVEFNGPHVCAGVEQRGRERAEAGPDFDDAVAGRDARELERFADDVSIDEKILAERLARAVPKAYEELAGFAWGQWHRA